MSRLEIRVASTSDDMQRVFALRAAVFMSEQLCPYDEEFDGNDYCATHILGLVDNEPAAILRIRYFAGFAKFERLAVLPRFRQSSIAKEVIDSAIEICRRKGYTSLYAHAQKRLVGFWNRFGFEPLFKNRNLIFSDHEYVEIGADLVAHDDPITRLSDPYLIIRPEGRWDEPGVLDRSAARPVTNPH
jgi:predicted GNAT family N-acyltransferase